MDNEKSSAPSGDLVAVTKHDTTPVVASVNGKKNATRGLYIGGAGNVTVITPKGQTVALNALAVGVVHPIVCTHVKSTGTTATDIVALF
jgi:hypothetical protein